MPAAPNLHLYLPGEDSRELWRRESNGRWAHQVTASTDTSGAVRAIEMLAFDSSPFFALNPGDDHKGLDQAIALRWESLGMEVEPPGKVWTGWEVAHEHGRVLVGTLALNAQDLPEEMLRHNASGFEPSISLYAIPHHSFVIYKELGRYVVAFMHEKRLVHVTVLSSRQLDDHAVTEIHHLVEALRGSLLVSTFQCGYLWTEAPAAFLTSIQQILGIPILVAPKPAPELPLESSGLVPPFVAIARLAHQKRRRQMQIFAFAVAAVALLFAGWMGALMLREHKINEQMAVIEARRPEVESARTAQLRWSALEEAVTPDTYPVEVFHQIVSLLPPEGIRFKEFSMNSENVVVSGEASSLIHASTFQKALKESTPLQRYTFNAPQPTIMDDNRASFRIEGNLNPGGADATQ
ncbi:PilN domain-containing protein [Phragmitibacter flavus]|uniref:PilN domain-containing protein n=1 Tax=Phragmitibacter flavus TaxID=2576071 RepID=A0A5R8KDV5_9BACT|nr:PilN domain-containing protein [Phragmitibacter flavus]TLD70125.1 PilN domain-containing protein [Phragmitibacter flavus]